MADLATKAYINLGEAHAAVSGAGDGDCNGDGRFDIADFAIVTDRNGNGVADPEDLILDPAYNNGVDDDGDGYVDDISGWDFLYGDNDPLDTVDYGHGTGEAQDSTAAENGQGDVGTCPNCRFLPVRVGDSFIADGGRFAAGVLFALDSGADVVQEALGALSNPRQAQQAIDAAYDRGVVVVASMADEASKHPNLPASLEHTMAGQLGHRRRRPRSAATSDGLPRAQRLHELRRPHVPLDPVRCVLVGGHRRAAGHGRAHRVASARDDRLRPHAPTRSCRCCARPPTTSTSRRRTPSTLPTTSATPTGALLDTVRYPTTPGWDATFGYGRVNIYEAVKAVHDGAHPARGRHQRTALVRRRCPPRASTACTGASTRRAPTRTTTGSSGPPGSSRRCIPTSTRGTSRRARPD